MNSGKKGFNELVFDIGAHKGDDTAVYLRLGFEVVAVEANPELVPFLQRRFYNEIDNQKLTILNYAIGTQNDSETTLYLSEDSSQSSLFNKGACRSLPVFTKTLGSLIENLGTPYFCKIDIEGSDLAALESLDKERLPPYISVEISGSYIRTLLIEPEKLFYTLDVLHKLGYTKFKLVDQERMKVLQNCSFYKKNLTFLQRVKNKFLVLFNLDHRSLFLKKYKLEDDAEVSGLPSDFLESSWSSYQEVRHLIEFHFKEFVSVVRSTDLIFWVDLHAAL